LVDEGGWEDVLDFNDLAPPWERPGGVRRDCLPHQGLLVLVLGNASFVCGVLALLLILPGLLGLVLGIGASLLGTQQLGRINAGLVDPDGRQEVERGLSRSVWGMAMSSCGLVFCGPAYLVLWAVIQVLTYTT
jgi:hypothetical protein